MERSGEAKSAKSDMAQKTKCKKCKKCGESDAHFFLPFVKGVKSNVEAKSVCLLSCRACRWPRTV